MAMAVRYVDSLSFIACRKVGQGERLGDEESDLRHEAFVPSGVLGRPLVELGCALDGLWVPFGTPMTVSAERALHACQGGVRKGEGKLIHCI